jgi:putative transposase
MQVHAVTTIPNRVFEQAFVMSAPPRSGRAPRHPLPRPRGRPRNRASGVWHVQRASFARWTPAHVTLKVDAGLWSLRGSRVFRALHRGLCGGNLREGFRLVEYSVQRNHIHLIPEASSTVHLSRGIQGLAIRLARALNRAMGRTGRVFADRYRSRLLTDPLDARNTLRYVLNNARRHVRRAIRNHTSWTDPCSSSPWFPHWFVPRGTPNVVPDQRHRSLLDLGSAGVSPRTPLLTWGWSRAGPIELLHIPGPKDVRPAGPKDVRPAGPKDVRPAGPKDVRPAGPKDVRPAGPKDVRPELGPSP